ncbi:luciferin 4-monooxygenase-like [Neocloeon triangulifer]|uniref:luciferin 4-monooxygenase-like n=1 Tax=Neocloeon triangulifer TaxID=2078957 RepID=UPI00286FA376|nr:luciferin 4-monooxygenase-like [Neocloeon triangulifer]
MEYIFESSYKAKVSDVPNELIFDYVYKRLCAAGMEKSTKPWVIDASTGVEVKFCDIEPQSRKIASALTRLGFTKGDKLHFGTFETAQLYLVQLAVWRLGGTVRGCFQNESTDEFVRQISETKARFILGDDETLPTFKKVIPKLDWPAQLIVFSKQDIDDAVSVDKLLQDDGSAFPENVNLDPDDSILIVNTSGSTGLPKGVVHTHKSVIACLFIKKTVNFFENAVMTPMSNYAHAVYIATLGSIANASQVIHLGKFERENYFDNLMKYKPASVVMYPFVATWFARHEKLDTLDLSFLKTIMGGGAIIDPTTIEILAKKLPGVRLKQMYGMSEASFVANTEDVPNIIIAQNEGEQWVSTGKLTPGVRAKIVDINTGESLGPGKKGEIKIQSIMLMKGYLSKDSPTPIRPNIDKDGWLSTGDAGFFDEDGHIFITERLSFVFKYLMYFVSPSEIESVLQKHERVFEVGVVGVPHPESTCLARAFVVRKGDVTEKELCDLVASRLPTYKHLHGGVRFVDSLPVSKGGKLDRAALKQIAIDMN